MHYRVKRSWCHSIIRYYVVLDSCPSPKHICGHPKLLQLETPIRAVNKHRFVKKTEKLWPDNEEAWAVLTAPGWERGARCRASDSRSTAAVFFTESQLLDGSRDSAGALSRGGLCSAFWLKCLPSSVAGRLNSESHHSWWNQNHTRPHACQINQDVVGVISQT